ncbi:MAG: hypothetical protein H6727_15155 [Myxococcales bacterium]|nr:hypothetical protein [Myxococcales bacterium]
MGELFSRRVLICLVLLLGAWACSPPENKACSEDRQCASGEICLQSFCLKGCRLHTDCPAEQFCKDLQCTEKICKPGESRPCYNGDESTAGIGVCQKGKQWCDPQGRSWSACVEQRLPQEEVCDSQDNNCDGQVDEGLQCDCNPGERRSCYTGPVGTQSTGLCNLGVQYCEDTKRWGACHDQGLPHREICDQLDNDCNGAIDDGIDCACEPGETRDCYSGPEGTKDKGACKGGKQVCGKNRLWGPCDGQILPKPEELAGAFDPNALCNGVDDNCDGSVDNRAGDLQKKHQRTCYAGEVGSLGKGDCKAGLQMCDVGAWGTCEGQVIPQKETCNGKDDDCNGLIDDGIAAEPCVSSTNQGCKVLAGGVIQCTGACSSGEKRCVNGVWEACQGETKPLAQELCGNGTDDDCNGLIDDLCTCKAGETRACYTGNKDTEGRGLCKSGMQTCLQGTWGDCQGEILPKSEICNNQDDDCDGVVDNLSGTCVIPGKSGVCASGVQVCENGSPVCKGGVPSTEVCSGLDDDCDGQVDNIADLGQACTNPAAFGVCKDGRWLCESKQKVCKPLIASSAEVCNGVDDDCDGQVDNLVGTCTVANTFGVCEAGQWACENGQKICRSQNGSSAEACNGVDDDCDGQVDNIAELDQACQDNTRFGVCRDGVWKCQQDAANLWKKTCTPLKTATTEVCNGLDDDCDGQVDPGCKTCQTNADCVGMGLCLNGYCDPNAKCTLASDCSSDQLCKAGQCVYCTLNGADCATGQLCKADAQKGYNVCASAGCFSNVDCAFGLICKNNRCLGCDPDAKDAQGQPINECGGQSACISGFCYLPCSADIDCGSQQLYRCVSMPERSAVTGSLCLSRCTQDSDCPQGFGCSQQVCVVSTKLSQGAYLFSDDTIPESCVGYRYPESGYLPIRKTGSYWIKPVGVGSPLKIFCDMDFDEGGFQLIGRYSTSFNLAAFDPTKHQLQDAQLGSVAATPPDLSDVSKFGHVQYDWFPPENREVRIVCSGKDANGKAVQYEQTEFSLVKDWTAGDKGIFGAASWGFLSYGGVVRTQDDLCGKTLSQSGGDHAGMAYCSGNTGDANAFRVSYRFDRTTGKTTLVCGGVPLTSGFVELWYRALGRNPLAMDSTGTRRWQDGSYAQTCKEYRFSSGGQYTGATGTGAYMIQPLSNNPPMRVYCDMDFVANSKQGGWTFFGRYLNNRPLSEFDPFVHFLQTSSGQFTAQATAIDLNTTGVYGHLRYDWLPIQGREIHYRVKKAANLECEEVRTLPITSWNLGYTRFSSTFLKLFSYKVPSYIGLSNGGYGSACHAVEKYQHVRMFGFLYCRDAAQPSGISGVDYRNGDVEFYCRNAIYDARLARSMELYVR